MKAVLYVATVVKTHIMEFHIPYLKMLKDMGIKTAVAARNDYDNPADCSIPYCDEFYDIPFERNPFHPGNAKAYKALKKVIDEGEYDIIHCHTPVGGMLTRLAAKDARRKGSKVFYTAHGFHFYTGAPLINWIAYYPVERWLAKKTDVLVTIAKEDYQRGQKFKTGKIVYIPGIGIDIHKFHQDQLEDKAEFKRSLGIPEGVSVLLSVGEINKNKNHQIVIKALPDFPDVWYVICGQGPEVDNCRKLAKQLGVADRVVFPGYRTDVELFYQMADIFVFPSLREGLPVALMEAMASKMICVVSRNRGTDDLLEDSDLRFDAMNVDELKVKLRLAMTGDFTKEEYRNREHLQQFDISNTLSMVKGYYIQATTKND